VPRTDAVLADPRLAAAIGRLGPALVKAAVQRAQDQARAGRISPEQVPDAAAADLPATASTMRPVINATGVLLHTNLGRAPLSGAARAALLAAAGCTDVEFDLSTGARAERGRGALGALGRAVPAAGAVHVVNNNAAALALAATALAADREIVLSRGEMVEIGDGFRLPDLLAATGARLREVGTTNRVRVADYTAALGPRTGFVLKVHPSNFRIEGFTAQASVGELAAALAGTSVPLVADIGSGLLAADPRLPGEPDADTALRAGAHLVTASADKLLGGPQAGLLLGTADLIGRLRRHPLARALRVDKLTLAALEATLTGMPTPTARSLAAAPGVLMRRARRLAAQLTASGIDAAAAPSEARVGGGGAPGLVLSSAAVTLPARFGPALRCGDPAVVGRVESGRFVLDLRAVPAELDGEIAAAIARAARTSAGPPADPPAATAGPATGAAAPPPGAGRIPDRRRRVLDRARPRRP
jgi:L-seryl-tRNA(Ser) seleniumtransferase